MMTAPFGLIVQACFFAFVVDIVAGWGLLGLQTPINSGSFIFSMLVATFLPVTIAADMGYKKGRAESLAKGRGQPNSELGPEPASARCNCATANRRKVRLRRISLPADGHH